MRNTSAYRSPITGPTWELFLAFSNDRYTQFHYVEDLDRVVIDLHASHLWDASTIAAYDAITERCKQHGKHVDIIGLNTASLKMRERIGGKHGGSHSTYAVGLRIGEPGSLVGNVIVEPTVRTSFP